MVQDDNQLKGELWQVFSHALANGLIAVGLVMLVTGALAFAFFPGRRLWLGVAVTGGILAAAALALHLIALV